jgi:hypothetical protein
MDSRSNRKARHGEPMTGTRKCARGIKGVVFDRCGSPQTGHLAATIKNVPFDSPPTAETN